MKIWTSFWPVEAPWCQMVTLQRVQGHTTLTCHLKNWHSGTPALSTECQPECPNVNKLKNGGLDQCDPERFGRLIFATISKNVGMKGLKFWHIRSSFMLPRRRQISALWPTSTVNDNAVTQPSIIRQSAGRNVTSIVANIIVWAAG